MTTALPLTERLLLRADRLVPPGPRDLEQQARGRVAVAQAALGLPFTLGTAALYGALGSPTCALALVAVAAGLAAVPSLLRRGLTVVVVANVVLGLTFAASVLVSLRTGGLRSPAVVWGFLLPLSVYAVAGLRSAIVWAVLATAQALGLYAASWAGVGVRQELSADHVEALTLLSHLGVLLATLVLVVVVEGARRASLRAQQAAERALDRQRILDDMHDGVGSQLLGLLVEARAEVLTHDALLGGLESCLDDLRLIVDSLDPTHDSLEPVLAALRGRFVTRCEALGVDLELDLDPAVAARLDPAEGLQLLRALQEMVTNALRHSGSDRVEVHLRETAGRGVALIVRDHGKGMVGGGNPRGRGLSSLAKRARALGGVLRIEAASPGLRVVIERPPASAG